MRIDRRLMRGEAQIARSRCACVQIRGVSFGLANVTRPVTSGHVRQPTLTSDRVLVRRCEKRRVTVYIVRYEPDGVRAQSCLLYTSDAADE